MKHKLQQYIYPIAIVGVVLAVIVANYIPGTFLVGWDNLYPELNFGAAVRMNLASVWQEYRGLGVQDAMAHAANIVHTLFMILASSIVPLDMMRYFYQFLMLLVGGLGMYVLLSRTFQLRRSIAFIGATFYQLNLITVQMFFAPLEVFSTHFAALPWLAYSLITFLRHPSKKNLVSLFLINLLATPQGFVPTVFIAYMSLVASVVGVEFLRHRLQAITRILVVLLVIICTNAFWLLPFIDGAQQQGSIVKNTKINQLSSHNIFDKNKQFGDTFDVLMMRGFMLDTAENKKEGPLVFIMQDWKDHISQPLIFVIATSFAALCVIGAIASIREAFQHKHAQHASIYEYFLPILGISFFMLGTTVPVLSTINNFLRELLPLFGEAFRFPFTKFSLVFVLCYTVFMIKGAHAVFVYLHGRFHLIESSVLHRLFYGAIGLMIFIYAFPVFEGHFFYREIHNAIPNDYFSVIEYFAAQPTDRRVMTLPQTTFWNWGYYKWGSRGSGFLWYGVEQAMLERPFDPWSNYNEQYLNEVSYALEYEDKEAFRRTVQKYDISYILIDENVVHSSKVQTREKLEDFIDSIFPQLDKQRFGALTVYKLDAKPYVTVKSGLVPIGSPFGYEFTDQLNLDNGSYYYDNDWKTYYLFPSLFTNKTQQDLEFDYKMEDTKLTLSSHNVLNLPSNKQYVIEISPFSSKESVIPIRFWQQGDAVHIAAVPITLTIGNKNYPVQLFPEQIYSVPNTSSQSATVRLNGVPAVLDKERVLLGYVTSDNTLFIDGGNGNNQLVPLNISNLSMPAFAQIINPTPNMQVQISLSLVQPEDWQTNNVLAKQQYVINAPCGEELRKGKSVFEEFQGGVGLKAQSSTICMHQYLSGVNQTMGTVIALDTETVEGKPLGFYVDNPNKQTKVIETLLNGTKQPQLIVIPPTNKAEYKDYGTHIRGESAGNELTYNKIKRMQIGYIPYGWIRSIRINQADYSNNPTLSSRSTLIPMAHPAKHYYTATLDKQTVLDIQKKNDGMLYLSQSYNNAWRAYINENETGNDTPWWKTYVPFFGGEELTDHRIVNNWANGWSFRQGLGSQGVQITIVFWPQYLQYAGFVLLGICGLFVAFYTGKGDKRMANTGHNDSFSDVQTSHFYQHPQSL